MEGRQEEDLVNSVAYSSVACEAGGVFSSAGALAARLSRRLAVRLAADSAGAPFVLFGPAHLVASGAVLALCAAFFLLRHRLRSAPAARRRVRLALFAATFLAEASWHVWSVWQGIWSVRTMLPLHLCSVSVYFTMYYLLTRSARAYEFMYFLGIGGASQAFITPDIRRYGFPHFRFIQFFIMHGLIIVSCVYMTVVEGFRPTLASLRRVVVWTNVFLVCVFFVNLWLGSNYLFVGHKPEFPTLIDALWPWPWYILQLEAIGLVLFTVMLTPYLVADRVVAAKAAGKAAGVGKAGKKRADDAAHRLRGVGVSDEDEIAGNGALPRRRLRPRPRPRVSPSPARR